MIGIAVCGAGSWGKNLVRSFAAQSEASLRYVVDLNEEVRAAMAKTYPQAAVTAELSDALNDPQVHGVVVAVEAQRHFEIAARALEAGKHTFVEKPLTLTAADAENSITCAKTSLPLCICSSPAKGEKLPAAASRVQIVNRGGSHEIRVNSAFFSKCLETCRTLVITDYYRSLPITDHPPLTVSPRNTRSPDSRARCGESG